MDEDGTDTIFCVEVGEALSEYFEKAGLPWKQQSRRQRKKLLAAAEEEDVDGGGGDSEEDDDDDEPLFAERRNSVGARRGAARQRTGNA